MYVVTCLYVCLYINYKNLYHRSETPLFSSSSLVNAAMESKQCIADFLCDDIFIDIVLFVAASPGYSLEDFFNMMLRLDIFLLPSYYSHIILYFIFILMCYFYTIAVQSSTILVVTNMCSGECILISS